ncbi:PQQ-binding-like beta-propeller repeat protein [Candidatus Hydrogenedentota bacterium]
MSKMSRRSFLFVLVVCLFTSSADPASAAKGQVLLKEAGITKGICSVVGGGNANLIQELIDSSELLIHCIAYSPDNAIAMRKAVDRDGQYGKRVVIEDMTPQSSLPYADNMLDVVIADQLNLRAMLPQEILRVLRPKGVALLCASGNGSKDSIDKWLEAHEMENNIEVTKLDEGWVKIIKPPMSGADEWPHWNYAPDNNPLSKDSVIKAPYMTQWMGLPYHIAMPAVTTVAGGRTFTAMGHIAHHQREEPWLYMLQAKNGYNGMELWRRKLDEGYMVHRSAFIATEDVFYMMDGDHCLMLDPETGEEIGEIRMKGVDGEWKWMAMQDDVLYVLTGKIPDKAEKTLVKANYTHWSWAKLSKGYYEDQVPWGFGQTIAAFDMKKEKVRWIKEFDEEGDAIDSRAMAIGKDRLFFHMPGVQTGCLSLKKGKKIWTNNDREVMNLIDYRPKGGRKAVKPDEQLSSTPGFRSSCYSMATPPAIVFAAQTHLYVVALSAKSGEKLWHHKKNSSNPNLLYADNKVLVGIGGDGTRQRSGYTVAIEPETGNITEDLQFKKRSCAKLTGCPDAFFVRAPEGLLRYDREAKGYAINAAVRPACNDGALPANGLLYVGPWLCDCNLQLLGTVTLAPAGDFDFELNINKDGRLQCAAKDLDKVESLETTDSDWSTYRANNDRAAASTAVVPTKATRKWDLDDLAAKVCAPPTTAGGLVFMACEDGKVMAVDAETGKTRWVFYSNGPVKVAPTIWNGRAYFGSGDGYVYALEAATGELLWKFQAAPTERKIMLYDHLSSTWPVNSGVLVEDGIAYFAAGMIDYDGTYVYALDAVTGKVIWENPTSGRLNEVTRKGVSAQGHMTIADGKLWLAGGHLVSAGVYDLKTGKCLSEIPGNLLTGNTQRGEEVMSFDDRFVLMGGKLLYSPLIKSMRPAGFAIKRADFGGKRIGLKFITGGIVPPAWNAETFVCVDGADTPPVCVEVSEVSAFLEKKTSPEVPQEGGENRAMTITRKPGVSRKSRGDFAKTPVKGIPPKRWTASEFAGTDTVALALTNNAAIAAGSLNKGADREWILSAISSGDGTVMWRQDLPSRPAYGGLAVDRDGRTIVVMADGRVVCYGG